MRFLLRTVLFFALLWAFGVVLLRTCARVTAIQGADLAELPCTPVLSSGNDNPHYANSWKACVQRCAREGRGPELDLHTCECGCR